MSARRGHRQHRAVRLPDQQGVLPQLRYTGGAAAVRDYRDTRLEIENIKGVLANVVSKQMRQKKLLVSIPAGRSLPAPL